MSWLCPEHPWSLWIWTSDLPNAGTDADISFQVYGERGKSDEIRLDNKTDNFEQGQVDRFMESISYSHHTTVHACGEAGGYVKHSAGLSFYLSAFLQVELPDLGKLSKFRIWHEKRNPFAGWHLSKVSKLKK